ncbi:MAG: universal stress protein [Nostocoides sp.]
MDLVTTRGSIVVGVDGSAISNAALDWAARRASARSVPLVLIHAFSADLPMLGFGSLDSDDAIRKAGEQLLATAATRAHAIDHRLDVATACVSGFAAPSLIRASAGAIYTVVGSVGHGLLANLSLGAVTGQVASHAKSPVVIVGRDNGLATPFGRVLVGVDGSATSVVALHEAFDHAALRGAQLEVVTAWQPRGRRDPSLTAGSQWDGYVKTFQGLVSGELARQVAAHPEVKVTHDVVRADPVRTLLERSAATDLVAVGNRGVGGFEGLHIGSVTRALMGHVPSPLLIARLRDEAKS